VISLLHRSSTDPFSVDNLQSADGLLSPRLVGGIVELGRDGVDVEGESVDHELTELDIPGRRKERKKERERGSGGRPRRQSKRRTLGEETEGRDSLVVSSKDLASLSVGDEVDWSLEEERAREKSR